MGGHQSLFLMKQVKPSKIATFSSSLWCYGEFCLVLTKYKGILNKIMSRDPPPPPLLYHIFEVKYSKIFLLKIL